jgi:hypothetical protein
MSYTCCLIFTGYRFLFCSHILGGLSHQLINRTEDFYRVRARARVCVCVCVIACNLETSTMFQYMSNKMERYTVYFIWKLLYIFRVVPSPIIRRAHNCIYSIWYLSHRYCSLPLKWQTAVTVWQIPHAVDTVVCPADDGWWYHPKHIEQFPDKINCVTLLLVGYILEYYYDARTHER